MRKEEMKNKRKKSKKAKLKRTQLGGPGTPQLDSQSKELTSLNLRFENGKRAP